MRDELIDAFDRADADDDVRAVIVTGAGRAFCAGADLSAGAGTFDYAKRGRRGPGGPPRRRRARLPAHLRIARSRSSPPINGPAVGVGVTMTLPMDIRIASSAARFGFVFARRGIVPEACSSWFLPQGGRHQPRARSGSIPGACSAPTRRSPAAWYRAWCAPEDLLPAARALAREIADNTSAVAVALSRQMLWRMAGADHPMEAHKVDSRGIFAHGRLARRRRRHRRLQGKARAALPP